MISKYKDYDIEPVSVRDHNRGWNADKVRIKHDVGGVIGHKYFHPSSEVTFGTKEESDDFLIEMAKKRIDQGLS